MKRILSMLFLLFLLLSGCSSVTKSDYEALQLEHELLEEEYSDLLLYVEDLEHEIDTYQSLRWDLEDIGTILSGMRETIGDPADPDDYPSESAYRNALNQLLFDIGLVDNILAGYEY